MKYFRSVFLFLMIFIYSSCFQKPLRSQPEPSNSLDSMHHWDVEVSGKGSQMFLDLPYLPCDTCEAEYLTLSVAKNKSKKRPEWISIILPCYEDQPEMEVAHPKFIIFLFLKKTSANSLEWSTDSHENDLLGFYAERCINETYTYRMMDAYTNEIYGENTVDVFRKFQEFDQVNFFIYYSNGSEKVVKVPLHSFQKQYEALE